MNLLAVDTETEPLLNGGRKVRTEFAPPRLVCASWCDGEASGLLTEDDEIVSFLRERIHAGWTLVFHNCGFDLSVLSRLPGACPFLNTALRRRQVLDTMVLHTIAHPTGRPRRTLSAVHAELTGQELDKGSTRVSFRRGVPLTPEQTKYAIEDAEATHRVATKLLACSPACLVERDPLLHYHQIKAESNETPFDTARRFSAAAGYAKLVLEPLGFRVDRERLQELQRDVEEATGELLSQLAECSLARRLRMGPAVGSELVGSETPSRPWSYSPERGRFERVVGRLSQKKLVREDERQRNPLLRRRKWHPRTREMRIEWAPSRIQLDTGKLQLRFREVADEHGIEAPLTDSGRISVQYDYWKYYKESLPEDLRLYLDYTKKRKLLGTYFRPLTDSGAHKVKPIYWIPGALTWRWACSSPNLQNQPKSLRPVYTPAREGCVFVSADYKSLELYTVCEAMHALGLGHGPLRRVLDEAADVHRHTAALLYDLPEEEVEDDLRSAAKIANFSLLGGMGVKSFLQAARKAGFRWTESQAADVRARWFRTFTDCSAYLGLFRVDPWKLKPGHFRREPWAECLGVVPSNGTRVTRWDLRTQIADGAVYECFLPTGVCIPHRQFTQAANLFFQHLGAQVITEAFNRVCEAGLDVCSVVHDEITVLARPEEAEQVADTLTWEMQKAQATICTCGVSIPRPESTVCSRWGGEP